MTLPVGCIQWAKSAQSWDYILLAGRIGGAGLCGGLGRGRTGTSASEARITLAGIGGAAARRRNNVAERLPIKVRTSMGLLLEKSPQ